MRVKGPHTYKVTALGSCVEWPLSLRASPPCRRKAGSRKALWRAPSLQPIFSPWHSPNVSCFLTLHIENVSGIFFVALTQVAKAKKNPKYGRNKEQRSPVRIVSGAGSLKSPDSLKSGIREGWGMIFSKAASKGLPRPFNAAGWRCSYHAPLQYGCPTGDQLIRMPTKAPQKWWEVGVQDKY